MTENKGSRKIQLLTTSKCIIFITLFTLISWLIPLLLGKYADYSYDFINFEQINDATIFLSVDDIQSNSLWHFNFLDEIKDPSKGSKRRSDSKHIKDNSKLCPVFSLSGNIFFSSENAVWSSDFETKFANENGIKAGGYWEPSHCQSRYSVTVIICERNRTEHLHQFITYIHSFLARQLLSYRLVVVHQDNNKPFNRGKLFNIGVREVAKRWPNSPETQCLVLHDVDLLPLSLYNLYACGRHVRHLTVAVDTFRFALPYRTLCGGAIALLAKHFFAVDGFSNSFAGWGGEDDDFCRRLMQNGIEVERLDPSVSIYHMLSHSPAAPAMDRFDTLQRLDHDAAVKDGLTTLQYSLTQTDRVMLPLYTSLHVTW